MIKEFGEKLIRLNDDDYKKIEFYFSIMFLLFFALGFFIGNIYGHIDESDKISNKLVSLSAKEGNTIPDNNYFKIDKQVYEIRKVKTSYITDLSMDLTHNYSVIKENSTVDDLLFNGIYGWFCYDSSSYEPAISDETKFYINRNCKLISVEIFNDTNRSVYIENGWVDYK